MGAAEVLVELADVADEAAMRGVVERTRARFGPIEGVPELLTSFAEFERTFGRRPAGAVASRRPRST